MLLRAQFDVRRTVRDAAFSGMGIAALYAASRPNRWRAE